MKIGTERKKAPYVAALLAAGAAAGFLGGFLGAGGGIILMYTFARLNDDKTTAAVRDNFASVVAGVLPLSVVSAICYSSRGTTDATLILRYIAPAAAGGVIGALITDRVNTSLLKAVFAVIVIASGINMLLR